MKKALIIFFVSFVGLSGFSQQDTTSSLDILFKQSNDKAKELKKANQPHLKGAVYGGIGYGGNKYKEGLAGVFGLNFHYSLHTINAYLSNTTHADEISLGFDKTNTLQSFNCGFMYGVGVYEKNISFSGGIGIGYTSTNLILYDPTYHSTPKGYPNVAVGYRLYTYSNTTGCAGMQLTLHGKIVGFTIQSIVNFSNSITNYAVIGGLSIGVQ